MFRHSSVLDAGSTEPAYQLVGEPQRFGPTLSYRLRRPISVAA